MEVTILNLLRNPFESRNDKEKLNIILGGKPRPKKYQSKTFDKEQWLTACDQLQAYYCWPCLLFSPEKHPKWKVRRFTNIKGLLPTFEEHKSTPIHINGILKLQLFLNQNFVQVTVPNEITGPVKKNRLVVKCIVDVVCHMVKTKIPVSNGVSICDQHLVDDCIEYLSALKTYDLRNIPDEAINLIVQSPTIVRDVVNTLTKLVATEIKNEAQTSSYVSLIMSEHSEIELKAKLSNVLRYLKDGKVCERFIGFNHSIAYKSSNLVQNHIMEILGKFEISTKLLAFSCDGSVLSMKHLRVVMIFLKNIFPGFQFVPCYYHDFDFVLEQTVSGFEECRLFFQNLRAIKTYLQGSSKIRQKFNAFISDSVPNLCDLKLSDSHFLRVLKLHRQEFITFFKDVEENFKDYSADDVTKASGFVTILEDLQTRFLLETFYVLFDRTAIFSETLSSCYPENVFEEGIIENIKTVLQNRSKIEFGRVWSSTIGTPAQEIADTAGMFAQEVAGTEDQTVLTYCKLYYKIMDFLASEIDIRLVSLENLNFFHILNSECQGKFIVYEDHLKCLLKTYRHCIDKNSLETELDIINSSDAGFVGNSVYELLEKLMSMDLRNVLKNVVNLAELILTMPCKPPSRSDYASKYDQIKAWSTVLGYVGVLNDFSVLAVEKDLLQHIKSQAKFCDEFMDVFQQSNNMVQVI